MRSSLSCSAMCMFLQKSGPMNDRAHLKGFICRMCYDSSICAMTQSYMPVLIHMWNELLHTEGIYMYNVLQGGEDL